MHLTYSENIMVNLSYFRGLYDVMKIISLPVFEVGSASHHAEMNLSLRLNFSDVLLQLCTNQ